MSVLDDFHQIQHLLCRELLDAEVIQDEKVELRQPFEEFRQPAFDTCHGKVFEELHHVVVTDLVSTQAGMVTESRSQPALSCAGRSGNNDGVTMGDIVTCGNFIKK